MIDEVTNVTANFVDATGDVGIGVLVFELDFHAVEFAFVFFDEGKVAFDELIEEIIEETLEAGVAPFFGVGDALDEFEGGATVIDKDDAFFV